MNWNIPHRRRFNRGVTLNREEHVGKGARNPILEKPGWFRDVVGIYHFLLIFLGG